MKSRRYFIILAIFVTAVTISNWAVAQERPPLFSILLGAYEIAEDGQANAGDLTGRGSATVIPRGSDNTICFAIVVSGIDIPSAAHIHLGQAGQNGPIVVSLEPPTDGDPGTSSGCVAGIDPALLADIRDKPLKYYVNVHTSDFPAGAVRGQLF